MAHILPNGATEIFENTLWKVSEDEKDSREGSSIGSLHDDIYVDYDTWKRPTEYDGQNYLNAVLSYSVDAQNAEELLKIATNCIQTRDALVNLGFSITHEEFDGDQCFEIGGKKMVPFEALKKELEQLKESVLAVYRQFYEELNEEDRNAGQ